MSADIVNAAALVLADADIDAGLRAQSHVTAALRAIRDRGMYADYGYATFEQYVVERWPHIPTELLP